MRVKCIVAYDGYGYAGWQKQINAKGIQEVIEQVLTKIYKKPIEIVASGRTDAKVHALGQVFHYDVNQEISCRNIQEALNTLLPKDIRIQNVEYVNEDFHARFSAKKKRYDYVCTYDSTNPFEYRYKHILWKKLDLEAMKEATKYFIGEHDFTTFSSCHIDPRKPRIKNVMSIELIEEGNDLRTVFIGTGFLRYQVRMMMQTLIEVGRGKLKPEDVKVMLDKKDKEACRYNAPAQGLYLVKVYYE